MRASLAGGTASRSTHAVSGALVPGPAPYGWNAVVRPDRAILHDGPVTEADRLVREALALLDPP